MVALHLTLLAFSVAVILFADEQAYLWFSGKRLVLSHRTLRLAHWGVWAGLLGMIASGAYMAYPMARFLLSDTLFITKMFFVGILVANSFLIGSLMTVAGERPFATLSFAERAPLFASGTISIVAWISAITLGFLLF